MKERYVFPAVFTYTDNGIGIQFPDLPGIITHGNNDRDALASAREALGLYLKGMMKDGAPIPVPAPLSGLSVEEEQSVVLIDVARKDFL